MLLSNKVFVEDTHGKEVGSWAALETGSHLDHPICHLCSILAGDLVAFDRVCNCTLRLDVQVDAILLKLFKEESRLDVLQLGAICSSGGFKRLPSLAEGIDLLLSFNLLFEIDGLLFLKKDVDILLDARARLVEDDAAGTPKAPVTG